MRLRAGHAVMNRDGSRRGPTRPIIISLYVHRDTAEAVTLVDRLIDRLQSAPGARVLDLGCGAGRHSRALAARGFDVTRLDLSAQSLARARRSETPNLLVESASHQVSGANWTMCSFPFSSMT